MSEEVNGMSFKDTITKQDLVEYAITKKVVEISNLKSNVDKKYKTKHTERENVKKEIDEVKSQSIDKYIDDNYGDIIKALEAKKGTEHIRIRSGSDMRQLGEMAHLLRDLVDMTGNHIIYIPNKKSSEKKSPRGFGYFKPFEILDGTIITIDKSEITCDIVELDAKFQALDDECKKLDKKRRSYEDKISKVKNQKDVIKANIIEEALMNSEDGVKMLESLKNIDFGIGDIKLIK